MTDEAVPSPSELVSPADEVLEEDLKTWIQQVGPEFREQKYREIDKNWRIYRFETGTLEDHHPHEYRGRNNESDRQKLRAAKAYLVAANRKDVNSDVVLDERLSDDIVKFVVDFDEYRSFDELDKETIRNEIRDSDSELYGFVKSNIEELIDQRRLLVNSSSHDIPGDEIAYFTERLEQREELAQEAVSEFIKVNGLPNTVGGIVEAANAMSETAVAREEVREDLREELAAVAQNVQLNAIARERALRARLDRLKAELDAGEGVPEMIDSAFETLEAEIETLQESRAEDLETLESHIDRVERLDSELADRITLLQEQNANEDDVVETIVYAELERLDEQRRRLAEELARLQRHRERIETTNERLVREEDALRTRVTALEADGAGARSDAVDRSSVVTDSDVVDTTLARLYEKSFVNRFEQAVRNLGTAPLPEGGRVLSGDEFQVRQVLAGNYAERLTDLPPGSDGPVEHSPVGAYVRYAVQTPVLAGWRWRDEFVLEAAVAANLYAYASNGFDGSPASIGDLLEQVNLAIERTVEPDLTKLVGIGSPTGWTDKVRIEIEEHNRVYVGENVRLCLIDLRNGELIHDQSDRFLPEYTKVFIRPTDDRRVREVERVLRSEYRDGTGRTPVPLRQVVEEREYCPRVVQRAFTNLEEAGEARRDYIVEDGTLLRFE